MAADRVAHGIAQRFEIIGLGEDGVTESARDEAAFRRFLDREDDLARVRTSCRHDSSKGIACASYPPTSPQQLLTSPGLAAITWDEPAEDLGVALGLGDARFTALRKGRRAAHR